MEETKSITLVLFGGTGDLAKKKILPALGGLIRRKVITKINLVATGRRPLSLEEYANMVEVKHHDAISINYLQTDFENKNITRGLTELLSKIEDDTCIGRLFYFAISPKYFQSLAKELAEFSRDGTKFHRLLFEKPFGHNLESSRRLNRALTKYFKEEDIFRVDHYLGKETVRNILALRLANPFFEKTWNSEFIDSIKIIVSEDMGVGNRIEYYDGAGAIRDMIQNHMLQTLAFILMDAPDSTASEDIHRQKVSALKKLYHTHVSVGQYAGYTDELQPHGKSSSDTETYVHLELKSESNRWKDTKILLITGKHLSGRYARIEIDYKKEPCRVYCDLNTIPNRLVINVQPKQDVEFYLNTPVMGNHQDIKNVKMNFCKECEFSENAPESYELVLEESIIGERTMFITGQELDHAWKLVDNIRSHLPRPIIYKRGVDASSIR